ncbi:MAG: amidase [Rhodospirillales bacterium]|nr:amidase [Rhodospirillales bacterium]QQS12744.1 MAG: amidase [Rhodospirillales bacterium]
MTSELWRLPADALRGMIVRKEVSPVEVTAAVLARADVAQAKLNCFVTLCHEEAMRAARAAEAAVMRGGALPPLLGVPYHVKDLVNTAGVRTTYGSLLHEHNVPAEDAVAAARMKAAGGILIGKTTTPEFGHKSLTDGPAFGRTANAWDRTRTAGGSSGGAAAAIAAGAAPIGIATDGGGSTRVPAACNGLVGLKQSNGVIPHSQVADAFGNHTYVTPLSRTVMDTALMLQAMAGEDASDPWSIGVPVPDFVAAARPEGDLRGRRVLWSMTLGNEVVARDVRVAVERSLRVLESLGATLEELREAPPSMYEAWQVINHGTWRARFADMVARHGNEMTPSLVRQVQQAADWTAEDYQKAMFTRAALFRWFQGKLAAFDHIVTPTLSRTALPIEQDLFDPIEIDGSVVGELRTSLFPYTMPFNITGHPAISLPCGFATDGLPIGLHVVGRFRDEPSLLRTAALYERADSHLDRWPDL